MGTTNNTSHSPQHLRVFLASSGNVAEERKLALEVLDRLPDDPVFRDKITIRTIAWDKPGAGTPMLATLTPQEAIKQGSTRAIQMRHCDRHPVVAAGHALAARVEKA